MTKYSFNTVDAQRRNYTCWLAAATASAVTCREGLPFAAQFVMSHPLAVQRKQDETVVFSWITWPSREARDESWKKVMADPRMQSGAMPPFDGKRMIYGGFEIISEL